MLNDEHDSVQRRDRRRSSDTPGENTRGGSSSVSRRSVPDIATVARWARKAAATPPHRSAQRAFGKFRDHRAGTRIRRLDATKPTYLVDRHVAPLAWQL